MRAFVFPGQGTQFVGMGQALAQAFPEARELLELADRVLGEPLSEIMARGPAKRLMQTEYTQPAVLVYSLALLRVLQARGLGAQAAAGYSLGEYGALVAAGCLKPGEAIRLVRDRALVMLQACPSEPRSMAIVVGPEREVVDQIIRSCPAGVQLCVAGYCTPGLHSFSGTPEGLAWLEEALKGSPARMRPVPVTLPFHSPLLAPALPVFRQRLAEVQLSTPDFPVIPNVSARAEKEPERLRDLLVEQLTRPVRWVESMAELRRLGVDEVWEVGPGRSLTTYLRKTDQRMKRVTIRDPDSLEAALRE